MAIEKYTTKCIIVESFDHGENDRVFKLFTRDYGLIMAHAKSIRKLESKLRVHMTVGSANLVTLVKGRDVWRIVGAEKQKEEKGLMEDVISLVKRFIRGEGTHRALYDRVAEFIYHQFEYDLQKSKLLLYYIFLVELGYADAREIGAKNLKEYISWDINNLYTHLLLSYRKVQSHVNAVLKEVQL